MLRLGLIFGVLYVFLDVGVVGSIELTNDLTFAEFMHRYNVSYVGKEREYREKVFHENMNRLKEQLKNGSIKGTFGVNKFAATTLDEFKKMLMPLGRNHTNLGDFKRWTRRNASNAIDDSYDYREKGWTTPVKNQGSCGSCYAFAAVAVVETVMTFKGEQDDFSEQEVMDCTSPPNSHCEGGDIGDALNGILKDGISKTSDYPYNGVDEWCMDAPRTRLDDLSIEQVGSEDEIADYVRNNGPVSFAFDAPSQLQHYNGGDVFDAGDCSDVMGGHGMVIVGYAPDYWICKNSWGDGWGDGGYVKFKRGRRMCNMQEFLGGRR